VFHRLKLTYYSSPEQQGTTKQNRIAGFYSRESRYSATYSHPLGPIAYLSQGIVQDRSREEKERTPKILIAVPTGGIRKEAWPTVAAEDCGVLDIYLYCVTGQKGKSR
jgi:hypothetical protein